MSIKVFQILWLLVMGSAVGAGVAEDATTSPSKNFLGKIEISVNLVGFGMFEI